VIPKLDYNIQLAARRFMAERAQAREVVEIDGPSHGFAVSYPEEVTDSHLLEAELPRSVRKRTARVR
jgi:hypothetical protein